MSTHDKHMAQAEHNEKLLNIIVPSSDNVEFGDWYATVAFYAALHHVEAMIAIMRPVMYSTGSRNAITYTDSPDHAVRNWIIKSRYKSMNYFYSSLYKCSRTAKYHGYTSDVDKPEDIRKYLDIVKKICGEEKLKKTGKN